MIMSMLLKFCIITGILSLPLIIWIYSAVCDPGPYKCKCCKRAECECDGCDCPCCIEKRAKKSSK